MLLAFGDVLVQEEKDTKLRLVQASAVSLGRDLALLAQEWVWRHQERLGEELEDELEDEL